MLQPCSLQVQSFGRTSRWEGQLLASRCKDGVVAISACVAGLLLLQSADLLQSAECACRQRRDVRDVRDESETCETSRGRARRPRRVGASRACVPIRTSRDEASTFSQTQARDRLVQINEMRRVLTRLAAYRYSTS